jgi:hypothetical protein
MEVRPTFETSLVSSTPQTIDNIEHHISIMIQLLPEAFIGTNPEWLVEQTVIP